MPEPVFPTRILALVDGSEPGRLALGMAHRIARATDAELHALHVVLISKFTHPQYMSETQIDDIRAAGDKAMTRLMEEAAEAGMTPDHTHVRVGHIENEVIKLAEFLRTGLVVVGNRGVHAIERILLGDEVESIVRHAHCPVLVARPEAYLRA